MDTLKAILKRVGIFLLKILPIYIVMWMFQTWAAGDGHLASPSQAPAILDWNTFTVSIVIYLFIKLCLFLSGRRTKDSILRDIKDAKMGRDAYTYSATKRHNPDYVKQDIKTAQKFQDKIDSLNKELKEMD